MLCGILLSGGGDVAVDGLHFVHEVGCHSEPIREAIWQQATLVGVYMQLPGCSGAASQVVRCKALCDNCANYSYLGVIVLWVISAQIGDGVDALLGGFVQ